MMADDPAPSGDDPAARAMREAAEVSDASKTVAQRLEAAFKRLGYVEDRDRAPFTPVGMSGGLFYVLDALGSLRELTARDLSRNGISALCGEDVWWLHAMYPRAKRGKNQPNGFAADAAADAIISACAIMGPWSPRGRVRGRGAWRGEDGHLVLHLGDSLWIKGRAVPIGRRGDFVYPLRDRIPRPAKQPEGCTGPYAAGPSIFETLKSWNLRRGELDARLMLGWIGAGMLGGALEFRPHILITGEAKTGKSTMLAWLNALHGHGQSMILTSDCTAPSLYRALEADCLPVVIDEMENESDQRQTQAVVKLARQASTGGLVLRSAMRGESANEYLVQSTFGFAAIIAPSLTPQDRSRFVEIELAAFDMSRARAFTVAAVPDQGRRLLRRMADHFPRLMGEVLPEYQGELERRGWSRRGALLYGTLLACADIALHDRHEPSEIADLAAELEDLRAWHAAEEAPEWRRCLDHLLATVVDPYRRGERLAVGQLLLQAAGYQTAGVSQREIKAQADAERASGHAPPIDQTMRPDPEAAEMADRDDDAKRAARALGAIGIRVMWRKAHEDDDRAQRFLAVANTHPALSDVFRSTHWAAAPGLPGPWRTALARTPGAAVLANCTRFAGVAQRAVLVPLEAALAGLVGPESGPGADPVRELYRPDEPRASP